MPAPPSSIVIFEIPESRAESFNPPTYTTKWKATGEPDDFIVAELAIAQIPETVLRASGILFRDDIKIVPDGWAQFAITVPYKRQNLQPSATGDSTFRFDTSGATVNIKTARSHIATYESGSGLVEGNFHNSSIGVKGDGEVEGVDIVIPALKMTYAFKFESGVVTTAFAQNLANNTGRTNQGNWHGFAAGELLFAGASGASGTDSKSTLEFSIIASRNESGFGIGDIASIAKDGHMLAWVEFFDDVEDGNPISKPKRVHIERVYDVMDFNSVLGF